MVTVFICDEIASDKGKVQKRLEKFFDFIGMEGKTIEEKSRVFVNTAKKEGNGWIFNRF